MFLSEFSCDDILPGPSCNRQLSSGALPCDAWHHHYHYQASAQYLWLAEALRALRHDADAAIAYTKAIFQDHGNTEALNRRSIVSAALSPSYDLHPSYDHIFRTRVGLSVGTATASYDQAAAAWEAGEGMKAHLHLDAAITADASHSDSYFLRGKLYFTEGRFSEAVGAFREAIRLSHLAHDEYHRTASDAHLARGNGFLAQSQFDLAIADFTKALDLHKGNRQALRARADAYRAKGSIALAEADERNL